MRRFSLVTIGLAAVILLSHCGQPAAPATSRPTVVAPKPTEVAPTAAGAQPTQAPPSQPPAAGTPTAGELAVMGEQVYKQSCASCHDGGFAPTIATGFTRFKDAQEMFNYMRSRMPQNNPGSLPEESYLAELAYEMLSRGIVSADTAIDAANLSAITFK